MSAAQPRFLVIENVRYDFGSCWVCGDDLDDVVGAQVITAGPAASLTEVCSLKCARDVIEQKAPAMNRADKRNDFVAATRGAWDAALKRFLERVDEVKDDLDLTDVQARELIDRVYGYDVGDAWADYCEDQR